MDSSYDHTELLIEDFLESMDEEYVKRYSELPLQLQFKIQHKILETLAHDQSEIFKEYGLDPLDSILNYRPARGLVTPISEEEDELDMVIDDEDIPTSIAPDHYRETYVDLEDPKIKSVIEADSKEYPPLARLNENPFAAESNELPGNFLKLDITTLREASFSNLGCLSVCLLVFFAFIGSSSFAFLSFLAFVGFSIARIRTDDYLLLDLNKKCIYHHKKFFSKMEITPLFPFSHVHCLLIEPEFHQSKESSWWTYAVCALSKDGVIQHLTDHKQEEYEDALQFTMALSKELKIPMHQEMLPQSHLSVYGSGSNLKAIYELD